MFRPLRGPDITISTKLTMLVNMVRSIFFPPSAGCGIAIAAGSWEGPLSFPATGAVPMAKAFLPPGLHERQILFRQRLRSFRLHVPTGCDPTGNRPWPVVLALHGGRTNAAAMAEFAGLETWGEREGFVVVHPEGTGPTEFSRTWNAGRCCGSAVEQQVDDLAFLDDLLDRLPKLVNCDSAGVYVVGMSNGGMLALRFAAHAGRRIAAAASISGPLVVAPEDFRPARPVPLLHFHGTADEFIPYGGGIGPKALQPIDFPSVAATLAAWIAANRCRPEPHVEELPPLVADGTRVERLTYPADPVDPNSAEIVHYRIHGGGHTWPGRTPRVAAVGPSTGNLSAQDELAAFFRRHRLPE